MAEDKVYGSESNYTTPDPNLPLPDQIKWVYDQIVTRTRLIQSLEGAIKDDTDTVILENLDAYADAKNDNVRKALVMSLLSENTMHQKTLNNLEEAREDLKVLYLERDKLRDIVEAYKAPGTSY